MSCQGSLFSCGGLLHASQQLGIMGDCEVQEEDGYPFNCDHYVPGVNSLTYDANVAITPIFHLSTIEPYFIQEQLPTVSISIEKTLDGYATPYLYATCDARNPTLLGRAVTKSAIAASMFACDSSNAEGAPQAVVVWSGAQVDSVTYNFPVEGASTESTTFVGNDMIWYAANPHPMYDSACGCDPLQAFEDEVATITFTGCNPNGEIAPPKSLTFREHIIFQHDSSGTADANGALKDPDTTILPVEVVHNCSGTNDADIPIQNISVSASLNREEVFRLGARTPKTRRITLPVTVETSIEVISDYDSLISFTNKGVCPSPTGADCQELDDDRCAGIGTNLQNRTIRIATCDGLRVYTGTKNKLASIGRNGGDASGAPLTLTYTYQTFNHLTVLHCAEASVSPSGAAWWAARDQWLLD